jgi:hypothetical protein
VNTAPTTEHACGNLGVIGALEEALAEARRGKLGFVIIAGAAAEGGKFGGYCGDLLLQDDAVNALNSVMEDMDEQYRALKPPTDPSLGWDYVCFNVPYSPLCYDFLCWLVDQEMRRVREGAPAPLRVGFFFGEDKRNELAHDPYREQMFENVVRPSLRLIGAIEDPKAISGHVSPTFVPRNIVAAARNGEKVPVLQAPTETKAEMATWLANHVGLPPVVITLREAGHTPHRNSDIESWVKFARFLQSQGERVVFVRDTSKADEPLEDFTICPQASRNLHSRMALNELAKINTLSSNGPVGLLLFSRCPWLQFIDIKEDGFIYPPDTRRFWRVKQGVEVGDQYPWSLPNQRIIWAKDTFANIMDAWQIAFPN